MGFSVTTVAIRGKAVPIIHREFGVKATGQSLPEPPERPVMGAALRNGWYLLYINDRIPTQTGTLRQLSTGAELVVCDVEEHAMVCSCAQWSNGREAWSVVHDSQRGRNHLDTAGSLPAEYPATAEPLLEKHRTQNDADYVFDIPVELFRSLTGFRYDGNPDGYPVAEFEVLTRWASRSRWWQFWK